MKSEQLKNYETASTLIDEAFSKLCEADNCMKSFHEGFNMGIFKATMAVNAAKQDFKKMIKLIKRIDKVGK